jgi:carbamoyl-phosphate synthase small subunit
MNLNHPALLVLEDGSVFNGYSFGAQVQAAGEVVFSTAMTGYPESLTDPSYKGQILAATYPLIGNYGVPAEQRENDLLTFFESDRVQITALVISDYSFSYSHWNATKSLSDWLKENNVPGIYGVDTRKLTRMIREKGAMLGKIILDRNMDFYDPNLDNLVSQVSCSKPLTYGNGRYRILLSDCGTKNNIIRCLLRRDTTLVRVPWDHAFDPGDFDGVLFSNGPGDPKMCEATIASAKKVLQSDVPFLGICLGSQIMALAAGADTYKLKYGHRSHNQPVRMEGSDRCFITSQNHGYAINTATLPSGWRPYFTNLNDGTCEGIRHDRKPHHAVQFHPEASAGPVDTEFLFDNFIDLVKKFSGK